jgi:fumarate hydratase class II
MTVHVERLAAVVANSPLLVTALAPVIGYERAARIAMQASAEGRQVKEVAAEQTDLSAAELDRLLDPRPLTAGGLPPG